MDISLGLTGVLGGSASSSYDNKLWRSGKPSPSRELVLRVAAARSWSEPRAARFVYVLLGILHSIDRSQAVVPDSGRDGILHVLKTAKQPPKL